MRTEVINMVREEVTPCSILLCCGWLFYVDQNCDLWAKTSPKRDIEIGVGPNHNHWYDVFDNVPLKAVVLAHDVDPKTAKDDVNVFAEILSDD